MNAYVPGHFPFRHMVLLLIAMLAPAHAHATNFSVHTVVELDTPLSAGEYFWDEDGVGPGQMAVVVDLGAERIFVYRGGAEIGRAMILRGWDEYATPTGIFPILEKDAHKVSNRYGGAPMPWSLRLTKSWVAIHGSDVDDESATHGCIGVPDPFARLLYSRMRVGDRVLVTNRWLRREYANP